jgi:hypothetical protein
MAGVSTSQVRQLLYAAKYLRRLRPHVVSASAKILCVEIDANLLERRCAALRASGYDVFSASPRTAEVVLRGQKFDLVIVSALTENDQTRILNLADGAQVMTLHGPIPTQDMVALVASRVRAIPEIPNPKRWKQPSHR